MADKKDYRESCPAFGCDETGKTGMDMSTGECRSCKEQDPNMWEACQNDKQSEEAPSVSTIPAQGICWRGEGYYKETANEQGEMILRKVDGIEIGAYKFEAKPPNIPEVEEQTKAARPQAAGHQHIVDKGESKKSRFGHLKSKQYGMIDDMLEGGIDLETIKQELTEKGFEYAEDKVKAHFRHLAKEHKAILTEENGFYRAC